jgi:CRISPR type I-E-associated protein CasB/Cse2
MSTEATAPPERKAPALINYFCQLRERDDRGTLALLRGALADSEQKQVAAWRVLARFGGIPGEDRHQAEVVRVVAGLMTLPRLRHYPGGKNFGEAIRRLCGDDERKTLTKPEEGPGPVGRRFEQLLAADRNEICERLRPLAMRLDETEGGLDFARLYTDLIFWGDKVKARWALSFWGAELDEAEDTQQEAAAA